VLLPESHLELSSLLSTTPSRKVFCPVCTTRNPYYRACGSGRSWYMDPRRFQWLPYECRYPPKDIDKGSQDLSEVPENALEDNLSYEVTFSQTIADNDISIEGHDVSRSRDEQSVWSSLLGFLLGWDLSTSHSDSQSDITDSQFFNRTKSLHGATCLKNKRVLFSGDSHMRIFFNAFMYQACGVDFSAQKGHATSQCHRPGAASGALCCIEFVYDLLSKASASSCMTDIMCT